MADQWYCLYDTSDHHAISYTTVLPDPLPPGTATVQLDGPPNGRVWNAINLALDAARIPPTQQQLFDDAWAAVQTNVGATADYQALSVTNKQLARTIVRGVLVGIIEMGNRGV